MISKLENGTLLAVLGEGTLYTSVVGQNGKTVGIAFTNKKNGEFDDESIVLQLTTGQAVASYMDVLFRFMACVAEEDGNDEVVKNIDALRASIAELLPAEKLEEK